MIRKELVEKLKNIAFEYDWKIEFWFDSSKNDREFPKIDSHYLTPECMTK